MGLACEELGAIQPKRLNLNEDPTQIGLWYRSFLEPENFWSTRFLDDDGSHLILHVLRPFEVSASSPMCPTAQPRASEGGSTFFE